jgi:hypothetical protein
MSTRNGEEVVKTNSVRSIAFMPAPGRVSAVSKMDGPPLPMWNASPMSDTKRIE